MDMVNVGEEVRILDVGGGVSAISLHVVRPNPEQPRKNGILQPITVVHQGEQGFMIVAGERGYRAAKSSGLPFIPARVLNQDVLAMEDGNQVLKLAVTENIQRRSFNAFFR
jgi:ParB family transcriptional regulator, chromosome partitioning protein